MARSYDAADIVPLPKLTAAAAVALGKEIITAAANAGALPATIDKALAPVKKTHTALRKAFQDRLPLAGEDSPDLRAADRDIDAAWSAAYDWASGWSKIPGKAHAAKAAMAQVLIDTLFADGLKFTQLKYKLEWAESQARVDAIADKHLDKSFDALGGGDLLKAIKTTHKRYGDLQGLTKGKPAEPEAVALREPLDAFTAALRKYVLRVSANVEEDDDESVALAKKLLAPLAAWESEPEHKAPEPAAAPAPAPKSP